ncbi:related to 5-carboxyvanillate decarboxylase [Armillaria ostoyae]|uniref:Related to 5-carboxyvanillate decarboxylase n=1 Tax=Armillaria ostoyae TaxID=47428 RepID=A0A284QK14_ARMOS|nr:related to 5-carboxyvanillate decarboxylase [Armillaria ostoyae]
MKRFFLLALTAASFVHARVWNDTGVGTIVFEEAWSTPEIAVTVGGAPALGKTIEELHANLVDVHNHRLALMDEFGIDFMVLSCVQPCVQGVSDPEIAAAMAVDLNNNLADLISNNTLRFGAFAALAMHNASVAAQELNRTVNELGFLGALLNDYQQSGPNDDTLLYYDQPEYDEFWQMVTDLDVPVYFHPRTNVEPILSLVYGHGFGLEGPAQEFAATLSTHILGLCTNGVFDRFPTLKIIVGHLGERLPSDLFRTDEQLLRQVPLGIPMQRNASSYWLTNLYETTAGNFATPLLQFHKSQIGLDRIMHSIDYPFALISEGQEWVNGLADSDILTREELLELKRGTAIRVLKLDD